MFLLKMASREDEVAPPKYQCWPVHSDMTFLRPHSEVNYYKKKVSGK